MKDFINLNLLSGGNSFQSRSNINEFPPCYICKPGNAVANPLNIIDFPGQPSLNCEELEEAALMGRISSEACPLFYDKVVEVCGCREINAGYPYCPICDLGSSVLNERDVISLDGYPPIICGDLNVFGNYGLLEPSLCQEVINNEDNTCGCEKLGPQSPSCFVCGRGYEIQKMDATIEIAGRDVSCRELSEKGEQGYIDSSLCLNVRSFVETICGCSEVVPEYPPCSVCGEGVKTARPDDFIKFPGQPDLSCRDWEGAGLAGMLTPTICDLAPSVTAQYCGCTTVENNPPCVVCEGENFEVKNKETILAFLGEPIITCAQFSEQGLNAQIGEDTCNLLLNEVQETCECLESAMIEVPQSIVCPTIQEYGCSICGEGKCITRPNAQLSVARNNSTCGILENAGIYGLLPKDECEFLPGVATLPCGCMEGQSLTSTLSPKTIQPTKSPAQPTLRPVFPTKAPVVPTLQPVELTASPVDPTPQPVRPTESPVQPTLQPVFPTKTPVVPTLQPVDPTASPVDPTASPVDPTPQPVQPTLEPTSEPSLKPTTKPTPEPTLEPSLALSLQPTSEPTLKPSLEPSLEPTSEPSLGPSLEPSSEPSSNSKKDGIQKNKGGENKMKGGSDNKKVKDKGKDIVNKIKDKENDGKNNDNTKEDPSKRAGEEENKMKGGSDNNKTKDKEGKDIVSKLKDKKDEKNSTKENSSKMAGNKSKKPRLRERRLYAITTNKGIRGRRRDTKYYSI